MEQAVTAFLMNLVELQKAVQKLCGKLAQEAAAPWAPGEVLTKLTPEGYVEAYLEVFERTTIREKWPAEYWRPRGCVKTFSGCPRLAILTRHGFSLLVRAQRYHTWTFCSNLPP